MDRKPVSFFDELFPHSPWRRPSPLEIEALGGNGMVDIESLSDQNGEEISSFSKSSANSVENISTNTKKLEKTKNKTALDQENLDFEVSRGAENVENLSNQDGQEISSSKFPANISTNSKKHEETKNKISFDQENLRFEASTDIESFLQKRNADNENLSLPACSNQVTETEFTAKLDENNSANIGDEVAKIKTSLKPLNLDFETSSEMDDTENLPSPSCSNQDDFDFSLSSPPKSVEKTSKLEENTATLEENIIGDEEEIETTQGDLNFIKRTLNFDTASVHLESEREILRDEMPQFNENLVEVNYS